MFDCHAHTNMSYCAESGLYPSVYVEKVKNTEGLDGIALTDHSMAIYFPPEIAWSWSFITDGAVFDRHREWGNARFNSHLDAISVHRNMGVLPGLEVEMMADGRLTFDDSFRRRIDVLIGSVHFLPVSVKTGSSPEKMLEEWRQHTLKLIGTGIDILGHPFRWLQGQMDEVPAELIGEVVGEARKNNVALELNSHYIVPADDLMLPEIVKCGAKLAFGTDSHRLDEVGNFKYHTHLLRRLGISISDLNIFNPQRQFQNCVLS